VAVVSVPPRKLGGRTSGSGSRAAAVCPTTGIAIPECSCGRCIEEQIRHHSPALLDRRFDRGVDERRAA
jgi:hypothetical protein